MLRPRPLARIAYADAAATAAATNQSRDLLLEYLSFIVGSAQRYCIWHFISRLSD